jgi:preprotein translocase SecY subunit
MAGRFLSIFKPISRITPEVGRPQRKVGFNEKLFWTALALILYLIMSEVPIYGVQTQTGDPFQYLRVIFASQRGSLMELGIGPIVTAGLILQLLAGSGMIQCNMSNPDDRMLFTTASKWFSYILITVQAATYIIGGVYGTGLDPRVSILVFSQLFVAGLVTMLLDEMLQKGWGLGSGISLFILAGVAQTILWSSLSVIHALVGEETLTAFGAIPSLIQTLIQNQFTLQYLYLRPQSLPTMLGFFTTLIVFLVVIYFEGVRVELPISRAGYKGYRSRYPIKLLYVSNLPVIFASALFANVYFISQIVWSNYNYNNSNFWFNLLGTYTVQNGGNPIPTGGLVYYVISPGSIAGLIVDPLRAIVYTGIMVSFCVVFSLTWLEVGGLGPAKVAKQLLDSGMQIPGFRRSERTIKQILQRYIPPVAVLGGIIVGLLAAVADSLGAFGTGTGILLSVGILYQYYQLLVKARVSETYPALGRLIGG